MKVISLVLLAVLLLSQAGCDAQYNFRLPDFLSPTEENPQPESASSDRTPLPGEQNGQTETPELRPSASAEPAAGTPDASLGDNPRELILWVPPEFDPSAETAAGSLLNERLQEFSRLNGGVTVQVRVKASSGQGGLLESLSTASAAAATALPSVVALSRADLEVAALKGLIYPLDGSSTAIDQPDWYDYARQLALVQGATFALPFAGDALILAYRPNRVFAPPADWDTLLRLSQPVAFPAGDAQALVALSLYMSLGGAVEDAQRRPTLQPEILSQVLQLMADGEERSIFPTWLSQYETHAQAWQSYRDGRVNALFTWASSYLSSQPQDTAAVAVPALDDTPMALATGWGWAVSEPHAQHRALSVRLAEFLSEGEFMAQWTEAAGYLPARPSALAGWSNQNFKTLLSPVAVSAQARPTVDQLASLGPVLKEATLKVLQAESDPTRAAQEAAERLAVPETR